MPTITLKNPTKEYFQQIFLESFNKLRIKDNDNSDNTFFASESSLRSLI